MEGIHNIVMISDVRNRREKCLLLYDFIELVQKYLNDETLNIIELNYLIRHFRFILYRQSPIHRCAGARLTCSAEDLTC